MKTTNRQRTLVEAAREHQPDNLASLRKAGDGKDKEAAMGRGTKLLLIAGLLAGSALSTPAQNPVAKHAPDLAEEVAGVNRSLERVALMLEQLLEQGELDAAKAELDCCWSE